MRAMMRPCADKRWLLCAAIAVSAYAAGHFARAALIRRGRIRRGELQPLRSHWREIGGLRVHALAGPRAAARATLPVVLVHGFGVSSSYFVPTAERLASGFEVYAPDLPGHGRTDTPQRACDIAGHAAMLVEWMDAMSIERASLVANSMGCQIAVAAALRHPRRIGRLVLIGPTLDPKARNLVRLFARLVHAGAYERLSLVWHLMRDYSRMGVRLPHELQAMRDYPMREMLRRIEVPALLVRGEHDAIAPRRWVEDAAWSIGARAKVVEIPGAAHAVNYSAPDALVARITPFLAQARA